MQYAFSFRFKNYLQVTMAFTEVKMDLTILGVVFNSNKGEVRFLM